MTKTSPCRRCGVPVVHTDDDDYPLCELHFEVDMMQRLLSDMVEGRLRTEGKEDEEKDE